MHYFVPNICKLFTKVYRQKYCCIIYNNKQDIRNFKIIVHKRNLKRKLIADNTGMQEKMHTMQLFLYK